MDRDIGLVEPIDSVALDANLSLMRRLELIRRRGAALMGSRSDLGESAKSCCDLS